MKVSTYSYCRRNPDISIIANFGGGKSGNLLGMSADDTMCGGGVAGEPNFVPNIPVQYFKVLKVQSINTMRIQNSLQSLDQIAHGPFIDNNLTYHLNNISLLCLIWGEEEEFCVQRSKKVNSHVRRRAKRRW